MSDAISASEASEALGPLGWVVDGDAVRARFRTGSFTAGVELIEAIAELAEEANHHPDVDLRFPSVTVHLSSHDIGGISRRDVLLGQQISAAARELDIEVERED